MKKKVRKLVLLFCCITCISDFFPSLQSFKSRFSCAFDAAFVSFRWNESCLILRALLVKQYIMGDKTINLIRGAIHATSLFPGCWIPIGLKLKLKKIKLYWKFSVGLKLHRADNVYYYFSYPNHKQFLLKVKTKCGFSIISRIQGGIRPEMNNMMPLHI